MKSPAHVVHAIPGRTRLRIPSERGEDQFFAAVADTLGNCPAVESATVNPLTGSVLVIHPGCEDFTAVCEQSELLDLVQLAPAGSAPQPLSVSASRGASSLNAGLSRFTEGALDLRSALFILLIGLGIAQMVRGNVMVPAVSLFWWAMDLALHGHGPAEAGDGGGVE